MSALLREITPPALPEVLLGAGFGRWEATPRGDGTFGVRKVGVGVSIVSGSHATLAAAEVEARELNGAPSPAQPKCICDEAFPGPIDARHCPACAQVAAPKLRGAL